jgi:transaldolase
VSTNGLVSSLSIKLFADGANEADIAELCGNPLIKGFTTNPTLMRAAGVSDYESFAKSVLDIVRGRPVSFEVFYDDFSEMRRQAEKISRWGDNVYVKIPVTDTAGTPSTDLIRELAQSGIKLNITAILTVEQVRTVSQALAGGPPAVVSVFAGRIADTGVDPIPIMKSAREILSSHSNIELLWASSRELLNIFQAETAGCHIITVTKDILRKLSIVGKDLKDLSRDTVKMFREDAVKAGYTL